MLVLLLTLLKVSVTAHGYLDVFGGETDALLTANGIRPIETVPVDVTSSRSKRQASEDYYWAATQCGYSGVGSSSPSEPYIQVYGRNNDLQFGEPSVEKAARLIHLMVRFMPRTIFERLSANSRVGLFKYNTIPPYVFEDDFAEFPANCIATCFGECSQWCTGPDYPGGRNYPISFLWAYGNFSRTYVVETNVICQGPDPSNGNENLLVREYGLTVFLRGLDNSTQADVVTAYQSAQAAGTWNGIKSHYDYFMKATSAWFFSTDTPILGGMNVCPQGPCTDPWEQRQHIKTEDPGLYQLLTQIYNNGRQYIDGDVTTC